MMHFAQAIAQFLDERGAIFSGSGNLLRFQYPFHEHAGGVCNGWAELRGDRRYEIGFALVPLDLSAQTFVQALPLFGRELFLHQSEDLDEKDALVLVWKSGRQYAGSVSGVRKALPLILEDAEHAIGDVLQMFQAEPLLHHPLLPEDMVGMHQNCAGRA